MASVKKYQDVDLYALLGVHAEATEKEVNAINKMLSKSYINISLSL